MIVRRPVAQCLCFIDWLVDIPLIDLADMILPNTPSAYIHIEYLGDTVLVRFRDYGLMVSWVTDRAFC